MSLRVNDWLWNVYNMRPQNYLHASYVAFSNQLLVQTKNEKRHFKFYAFSGKGIQICLLVCFKIPLFEIWTHLSKIHYKENELLRMVHKPIIQKEAELAERFRISHQFIARSNFYFLQNSGYFSQYKSFFKKISTDFVHHILRVLVEKTYD